LVARATTASRREGNSQLQLQYISTSTQRCIPFGPASFIRSDEAPLYHSSQLGSLISRFGLRREPDRSTADRLAAGIRLSIAAAARSAGGGHGGDEEDTRLMALRHLQPGDVEAVLRQTRASARAGDRLDE
jgi:hypothetical protein